MEKKAKHSRSSPSPKPNKAITIKKVIKSEETEQKIYRKHREVLPNKLKLGS